MHCVLLCTSGRSGCGKWRRRKEPGFGFGQSAGPPFVSSPQIPYQWIMRDYHIQIVTCRSFLVSHSGTVHRPPDLSPLPRPIGVGFIVIKAAAMVDNKPRVLPSSITLMGYHQKYISQHNAAANNKSFAARTQAVLRGHESTPILQKPGGSREGSGVPTPAGHNISSTSMPIEVRCVLLRTGGESPTKHAPSLFHPPYRFHLNFDQLRMFQ